jgi:TfoX/Sxy family transcriptional regulator of competence genes
MVPELSPRDAAVPYPSAKEARMPEMPKFTKTSPEVVERFVQVLERHGAPDVVIKPMFGYKCAWIGGNMLTGLFADEWWVRVSEPDRDALLALPGAHPFEPMPGRSMGRYVVLPAEVAADDAAVDAWLEKAIDFTRTLPPKKK